MEILVVSVLLAVALVLFITEKLPVDLVAFLILAAIAAGAVLARADLGLHAARWVTLEEAISGFSSGAVVTIAGMFILSAALQKAGVLAAAGALLGRVAAHPKSLLVVLMLVVSGISAFLNNTAAVAILLPVVLALCREHKLPPSKLLIPLSFASQFGGVCTLIGTSTNLVVSQIATQRGLAPIGMFEVAPLGIVLVAAGVLYFFLLGQRLLPDRPAASVSDAYSLGPYVSELRIMPGSPLIGQALGHIAPAADDVAVLEVIRGKKRKLASFGEAMQEGDLLLVNAEPERLVQLKSLWGVEIAPEFKFADSELQGEEVAMVEVLVAPRSRLSGHTLAESDFRARYGAIVLAVRRRGHTFRQKLASLSLRFGDALLLLAPRADLPRLRAHDDLLVLQELTPIRPDRRRMAITLGIAAAVVTLAALNLVPILAGSLLAVGAIILTRCLTVEEAYQAIDWKIVVMLAALMPLGLVMERSGAAQAAASATTHIFSGHDPRFVLAAIYLLTLVLTELMSNSATALLMAPIAISTASAFAVSPRPFLMAVCFAASVNFATPVGYQTNLMVYGPGGYRFADYLKVGIPLDALFALIAITLIPIIWPFS